MPSRNVKCKKLKKCGYSCNSECCKDFEPEDDTGDA